MTYRELLKLISEKPGCIQTKEQQDSESNMMYQLWLDKENEEYLQAIRKRKYVQ